MIDLEDLFFSAALLEFSWEERTPAGTGLRDAPIILAQEMILQSFTRTWSSKHRPSSDGTRAG